MIKEFDLNSYIKTFSTADTIQALAFSPNGDPSWWNEIYHDFGGHDSGSTKVLINFSLIWEEWSVKYDTCECRII